MRRILVAFLLVLSLTVSLWALSGEYGSPSASGRILIAYEPTRFKNNLVSDMISILEERGFFITVVDHQAGGLGNLSAADFDAVFITNSGATAMVRVEVVDWLVENGTTPDNVYVHTTQITEWEPQIEVDGVTSASYNNRRRTGDLAEEYAQVVIRIAQGN
jgi:hypothetical protein